MADKKLYLFFKDLNNLLANLKDFDPNKEIKTLIKLEKEFVKKILDSGKGEEIYKEFINYIISERSFKRSSPFFRERESKIKNYINKSLRESNYPNLYKAKVNYNFCAFVVQRFPNLDSEIIEIFNKIKSIRENIITKYMHHVITRANVFNKNKPYSSEYFDLIQSASEGLIHGIDKYVPGKGSSPLHMVIIGRIIAELISHNGESLMVNLGYSKVRKLYKIKKITEKRPGISIEEIAKEIQSTPNDVSDILNAINCISLDDEIYGSDYDQPYKVIDFIEKKQTMFEPSETPYTVLEKKEIAKKIKEAYNQLSVLERKVLRLKGFQLNNNNGGEHD